jgi:hypothetical protein
MLITYPINLLYKYNTTFKAINNKSLQDIVLEKRDDFLKKNKKEKEKDQ